jgi:hypothetical protein
MAFTYGTIWGDYGDEKVVGSTKLHPLGSRMVLPDGRAFRYGSNSTVELHAGVIVQSAAATAADDTDVPLAAQASVGDKTISITAAGTIAANKYADGLIYLNDGTGEGTVYKIASHLAGTGSATMVVNLYDGDTVAVATDSTVANTLCGLALNTYSTLVVQPTTITNLACGVTPTTVTASTSTVTYYFWAQTWGEAAVLANAAGVVGQHVRAGGTTTPGGYEDLDRDDTHENEQAIGVQMQIAPTSGGDYGLVFLQIAP